MGLLLDANQIPVGMKIFSRNESEKPVIRNIIDDLKQRNNISGRTIQIADKGLNCINNILHAVKNGDGYIFSKSVKLLPETEKTWVLLENDYVDVKNKKGEVLFRMKECVDDFTYVYTDTDGHKKNLKLPEKRIVTFNPKLAGYKMIITSEIRMSASEIYAAYHNLWRIEESFRVMKSQLEARPVYLQKKETIIGHFLICYLAVLLTRLLQIHVLDDNYGTEELFSFMHDFRIAKISDRKYINLTRNSSFITDFSLKTGLPLTSYFLGNEDINKVLSHRF